MGPMMNALELDAMTLHWEFAYGPDGVRDIARALNYPVLAINRIPSQRRLCTLDVDLMTRKAGGPKS